MGHTRHYSCIGAGIEPEARCMLGERNSIKVVITTSQEDHLAAMQLVAVVVLGRQRRHPCTGGWNSIHVEGQRKSYCLEHAGDFLGSRADGTKRLQIMCLQMSHIT